MTKPLVLARDDDGDYTLFNGEPHQTFGYWVPCGNGWKWWTIAPKLFPRIYGRHLLRKGRKAEVEITIKVKGKK